MALAAWLPERVPYWVMFFLINVSVRVVIVVFSIITMCRLMADWIYIVVVKCLISKVR